MPNFEDIAKVEQPQSILLFGRTKSGKTEMIASLANSGYKVIYVDLEAGKQTLVHAIKPEFRKNLTYIRIPDSSLNPVGIVTVGKMLECKTDFSICYKHGQFNCPTCIKNKDIIDTLNLTNLDANTVLVIETATQLSASASAYTTQKALRKAFIEFEKQEWEQYNHQGTLLDLVLSAFQQLTCHRIITTHDEILESNDGMKLIAPKAGTRNYSRNFGRFFDHIVYLYMSNGKHKAASSTDFNTKVMAGSRSALRIDLINDGLVGLLRSGAEVYASNAKQSQDAMGNVAIAQPDEFATSQVAEETEAAEVKPKLSLVELAKLKQQESK